MGDGCQVYDGLQLYWGDMHTNYHNHQMSTIDRTFEAARSHLDFFPIAYYPFLTLHRSNGLIEESVGQQQIFLDDWQVILASVEKYNDPGNFVTFPGYEWHGDRRRFGDHNVFYFEEGPLSNAETLPELYEQLRKTKGIAIPHHTGYQVGERGKDWDYFDPSLSPFTELFSDHGSSEGCSTPFTLDRVASMGPRTTGGNAREGLLRGYRLGLIASGDNHTGFPGVWGNGLTAVWAPDLTRESLWDAFLSRKVYGVTGDRIQLKFELNGQPMGSAISGRGPAVIKADIEGWDAIDRIELLRNEKVIHTYCHSGNWDISNGSEKIKARIRIDFGWGPTPWNGFKVSDKQWEGKLVLDKAKLLDVQGAFSCLGQRVERLSERECTWHLETKSRPKVLERSSETGWAGNMGWYHRQSLVFCVEASSSDKVLLDVDGEKMEFSMAETLESSRVMPLMTEAHALVREQFGLSPDDIENADLYWQNAYKVKVHTAVPESAYSVPFEFVDEDPPAGQNWYRLRVSQLNGQMAWSSPIWFDNR